MSIAGTYSNRGDGYQTYIALDWALTVMVNPDYQWIEVDSVSYSVDDVVIGKSDGALICCQCKKNQTNYRHWTIADLADELIKASSLLANNMKAEVRFYSRSPFGKLAKLREYATTQPTQASYKKNLTQKHQETDTKLATEIINRTPNLSTYEFLRRTTFETSSELDRLETLLHERLRSMASNSTAAFNALWTRIDHLGGRMSSSSVSASPQHRLIKEDLKAILQQAGAMLAPSINLQEARASFISTSAIGRSWQRHIAKKSIPRLVVNELLAAIDSGKRAILLTGLPGSGKTCVMLAVQEALEKQAQNRTDLVPIFIQAREFADLATVQERQAQGLSDVWVEQAARMAEEVKVVVVIDSLDVLSIAREHSILTYFLAQIDRLLLVPNITVVTACRDFDRHYDRRIAGRQWDCELNCPPLNWESEVIPLLDMLGIHTATIDTVTRELIQNPRELVLFVELAQQEGSFNIVTSQALAQRYLETIVRANNALGEKAIHAIEAVANEMLSLRSLSIPQQRFNASQDIQRELCSLNVLQQTQDGKLTFGHQTLLDVLVISSAVRSGITLNDFIQTLPPVPFVRPSIRSFVAQLATGERSDLRKQLRTVLTGSAAFHVRRLIAESYVEQIPQDDDWPLIRDLRNNHREIFQVIYTQGALVDWHHFWLKHLKPVLIDTQDEDGLTAHVHRVSQWINEDAVGVLQFWTEALSLDWFDGKGIAGQFVHYLSKIDTGNLALITPLLDWLLSMPRHRFSSLGRTIARCVSAGVIDDIILWRYVAGDISDDDVTKYRFDDKLHCQPHEFGNSNNNFFCQRMEQSTTLLDMALESIEQWSLTKSSRYDKTRKGYRSEFLSASSYEKTHSQNDHQHSNSEDILLDAIEAAILHHAQENSIWWQSNCERLGFNHEGALRYFTILACINNPEANIGLVERMLCDKELLESDLSYELGTLIKAAFIYFATVSQDAVMSCILTVREESIADEQHRKWILKKRCELIVSIPRHLRSSTAQAMLDAYEKEEGVLIRQPHIRSRAGTVRAPFSFEVFLNSTDRGVLGLLAHYSGHIRDFDEYLIGGEQEVGSQLCEAASRHPIRFLSLLSTHWFDIPEGYRDEILYGTANHLKYRYGNLQANGTWAPKEEPNAPFLVSHILDELERHHDHWHHNRAASDALEACAHVINDTQNATRLVFLAIDFVNFHEEIFVEEESSDLANTGIGLVVGHIAEGLMILVDKLQEENIPSPELLLPTLRCLSGHEHPAIRALILRRLPFLQSQNPELGWDLFERTMHDATGLWQVAERCLYYAYHNHFEKVGPLLDQIRNDGTSKDLETWGLISALAALSNRINFVTWLENLKALNVTEAWRGAARVWTHPENIRQYRDQCLTGIEAGLNANSPHAGIVARQMKSLFEDTTPIISIPIDQIRLFFTILENNGENQDHSLYEYSKWLNAIAHRDPEEAIAATEIFLSYLERTEPDMYDHDDDLTQLMTRLFAEAEEREESDQGEMLRRVVSIQDTLLSLGLDSIHDWLKAAERP